MSDIMTPTPFKILLRQMIRERAEECSVFGVEKAYVAGEGRQLSLFNEALELPFGVAAGPHTQLAQNIAAAYYAGARFFELKTVQTIDGEKMRECVKKPCIEARVEGFNTEWSTELTVEQAMEEYVKAWFLLKLMAMEFKLGDPCAMIFNMSVGYDYKGITSPKLDRFIDNLKDARATAIFNQCKREALGAIDLFENVCAADIESISPNICSSVTLSTLHGCPPTEIKKILEHLIKVKKLNTFVKCNPTILGLPFVKNTLETMGYGHLQLISEHFENDLSIHEALPMFKEIFKLANSDGLQFGLKISNTLPVKYDILNAPQIYMSGKPLYALSVEVANRFSAEFDGRIRVSYSGGADAFNIVKIVNAGIWPVTLATTLLKPGGYERLTQLAEELEHIKLENLNGVEVARINTLARSAAGDSHYTHPIKPIPSTKVGGKLPLMSCFRAPCKSGCPIGQDIPEYISLIDKGEYIKAMELITEKNPLPFVTSRICPHPCMDKCTRVYYEEPVRIRNSKKEAIKNGYEAFLGEFKTPVMTGRERVAIIGGGPAGLSAAYFISRAGIPVTLFEKSEHLGGVVRHVIPSFRLPSYSIERDMRLISKTGASFITGKKAPSIAQLKQNGYSSIVIAVGAGKPIPLDIEGDTPINATDFLRSFNLGECKDIGGHVCVIGAGNTAIDASRAALRVKGVKSVSIVYRRTKRYMPAELSEFLKASGEGVSFIELLSPIRFNDNTLTCAVMQLSETGEDNRPNVTDTGKTKQLRCDTLISAVGETVDDEIFAQNAIELNGGRVALDPDTLMTRVQGVYVIGDAHRGPATVVEAIADAKKAADSIIGQPYKSETPPMDDDIACIRAKRGKLMEYRNSAIEADRCLGCNYSCELCVQVCPNRSNVAIEVFGLAQRQIIHIERSCNECGNCATFCPYDDEPYKAKLTLFDTKDDFTKSDAPGFIHTGERRFIVRLPDCEQLEVDLDKPDTGLPKDIEAILWAMQGRYSYLFV